jgi:ESS family glutamate:Na+ symporter
MRNTVATLHPVLKAMPVFPYAMMAGLLLQAVATRAGLDDLIDKGTVSRISGLALEFLIIAAVATLDVKMVISYFLPFTILMVAVAVFEVWVTFWLGPKMYPRNWFECAMGDFGIMCGIAASALMLTRIVDPENKTVALRVFAFKRPFSAPFIGGGIFTTIFILMSFQLGPWPVIGIWAGGLILSLALSKSGGWWDSSRPKVRLPENLPVPGAASAVGSGEQNDENN